MQTVTTIGLDIAESVFQVHGQDAAGQVVIRRQSKRRPVLVFGSGDILSSGRAPGARREVDSHSKRGVLGRVG